MFTEEWLMKLRLALAPVCLVFGTLAGASAVRAATYDLSAGFDTANNVGSSWSVTYSGGALPHQASAANNNPLYPAIPSGGFFGVGSDLNNDTPFAFKAAVNGSSANGVPGETLKDSDFLAGDIIVHTPDDGSALTISWTAPTAGILTDLITSVWYAHSTVDRSNVVTTTVAGVFISSVPINNVVNRDRDHAGQSNVIPFNLDAGDLITLSFAKSGGTFGSLAGVAMSFDFTASAVTPIPAALPLFVSALVGLGWLGRRRREQAA
jgi:hypothetical protein